MDKKAILYSLEDINIGKLKKLKSVFIDEKKEQDFLNYCKKHDIKALYGDEVFLKKAKPIPLILYYIGNYNLIKNKKIIGIVGPRKMTNFIKNILDYFFQNISGNIAIISGLAEGTDQYAHKLALKYNISTIGVLGYGIANGLNGKQRYFIQDIKNNNGLIISQFPLKQTGTNWTFPVRNKIIAGISDILFVPQAQEKSGSLITIEESIKLKNPVYSCFSSIQDEMGKGTNRLIKESKVIGIYDMDIFIKELKDKYKLDNNKESDFSKLSKQEQLICKVIKEGFDTLESISFYTKKSTDEILNILSMLEIEGIIGSDGEKYFTY